ncbi:hypothetical protein LTR84_008485 [Exophiala bonariae]|uniref:EthD domain-containing protein n=1 Tax=Exophiala bonariae TaxID=1690606 RepID=A0AAV9MXB4_9EURO|nr:hypothetical protein LTR84_008485 [Exophiala bonariae]
MSDSASPSDNASTSATSTSPLAGVLWVTTSVMNPKVTAALLDAWYDEHKTDVLGCPGNGRLFLRYKNIDKSVDDFADPKFADRFTPTASIQNIANAGWPYLAFVKLSDLQWLVSQQFIDMPRVSKLLPLEAHGSIGSAFSNWHAGLRSYETIARLGGSSESTERPQYIVSIQTEQGDTSTLEALDKKFVNLPGFRGSLKYRNVNGLLEYQEPGPLPEGLVLYEFDEQPPAETLENEQIRTDVWELTIEWGDLSLVL